MLFRDRVNQAARDLMLQFAIGPNADAIGSRYPYGMPRLTGETDVSYRRRIWLSPDILNPRGGVTESYAFWALTSLGADVVRDASAFTVRGTGKVFIPVLLNIPTTPVLSDDDIKLIVDAALRTGLVNPTVKFPFDVRSPIPNSAQVLDIYRYVIDNSRKGLTDEVVIVRPKVTTLNIRIQLWTYPGYDNATVLAKVARNLFTWIEQTRWLGYDQTILGIDGTLNTAGGVYNRVYKEPTSDIIVGNDATVQVTGFELQLMGVGE